MSGFTTGSQVANLLKNASLFENQSLIGGQWRTSAGNQFFNVYEPSSGEILASCVSSTEEDFSEAIELAHIGFQSYSTSSTAKERGLQLRKWYELILENADDCL